MGHISNMGHSLNAIKYIVDLHKKIGSDIITVYIKSAYPFFDEDAYKEEVEECLIKHNKDYLERKLKGHLEICERIIESWEGRFRFWEDCARLNNEKYEVDRSISYKIHCILGGRKCDIGVFYGDMLLLRYNNGKVEERNPHIPFSFLDNLWSEHKPERKPIPDTDIIVGAYKLVSYVERIRDFLTACLSEEKSSQTKEQPQQQLEVPLHVLKWLQETKCANGKAYIEDAASKPWKWLQNKQLARELLTHKKIKGDLTDAEAARQVLGIFIDKKCQPLRLAKPDKKRKQSKDSDNLSNYLATLQLTDL